MSVIDKIKFNSDGLVPVIAQQFDSGEVLMLAWMNKEAIEKTLETGDIYYFSRSRNSLWRKGEQSGQTQSLKEFMLDCDEDSVLIKVDQTGVACHTGRKNCFFNTVKDGEIIENQKPEISEEELYGDNN